MKTHFTFVCLFIFCFYAHAQDDFKSISASQVETGLYSNGAMHSGMYNQTPGFKVTKHNGIEIDSRTIFGSNVWLGGLQPDGEFNTVFPTDFSNCSIYTPGPMGETGNTNFDGVWRVDGDEIRSFKLDLEDGIINNEIPEGVRRWPARGNYIYGSSLDNIDLAAFFDENGDGIYNPKEGDFPIIGAEFVDIVPAQMAFTVVHTNPASFGYQPEVELQTTMYTLECDSISSLDRFVFTRHKVLTFTQGYDEFYFGLWSDFRLGCYADNYIGSSPLNNAFYTYNEDPIDGIEADGACGGYPYAFDFAPPVHGMKMLNATMDVFAEFVPSPATNDEIYNVMTGNWRDGTPITYGGNGLNPASTDVVSYLYPDLPTDADGWSMYTEESTSYNIQTVAVNSVGPLQPGQSFHIDMVNVVTLDEEYDHIEKVQVNLQEMQLVQELYDNGFENVCGIVNKNKMEVVKTDIEIYPNPNDGQFNVAGPIEYNSYEIFNIVGNKVASDILIEGKAEVHIEVPNGMYLVRLLNETTQTQVEKVIIANN